LGPIVTLIVLFISENLQTMVCAPRPSSTKRAEGLAIEGHRQGVRRRGHL
jgi:hypothetical protein